MDRRRFILRETLVSIVINTVLSIGFFLLVFGQAESILLWGMGNWVFDAIPQSFMIALMGTLVPGLVAGKALRARKLAVIGMPQPFSRLVMRALITALIAAAAGYAFAGLVAKLSGLERFGWTVALAIKAAYGAALAAIVTPLSLRAALAAGQG